VSEIRTKLIPAAKLSEETGPPQEDWGVMVAEPDWLTWTRELQAIAQTGLAFARDPYDRERYEMLRVLASRMMAAHTAERGARAAARRALRWRAVAS
jgi:hypothetical protein